MAISESSGNLDQEPTWRPDAPVGVADVLILGDTGFGQSYADTQNLDIDDLHEGPFEHLDGLLTSSDLVIANLETVFTHLRESPLQGKRPYLHYDDPITGPAQLRKHNISAVTFANNHVMDMGQRGFVDTLEALESHGIMYAGAGRNLDRATAPLRLRIPFVGGGERRVTLLTGFRSSSSFNQMTGSFATPTGPGCNPLRNDTTLAQIRALRQESPDELIIVAPHWRRDYKWTSDAQREFARTMTRAGADLIIGHGSHMAQEIDIHNGVPLLHGIGNFLFNSKGRYEKLDVPPYSIAVRLHLTATETTIRLYPLHTNNRATKFRSHPVTDEQFEEFYLTALERTSSSAAFLRVVGTARDDQGHFLEIPLRKNRRAYTNPHRRGHGSTLTYWEPEPVKIRFDRQKPNTGYVLERELRRQGATIRRLDSETIAGHSPEGLPYLVRSSVTNHTGVPGSRAVKRKDLTRRVLQDAGAPVARGQLYRSPEEFDAASALMLEIGPVVVKPVDGNIGRGVTVGVHDVDHLKDAWTHAFSETTAGVLLEEQFEGDEFRISVVDGVACAATKRVPPQVTGDGVNTIRELINEKNDERHRHLILHSKPIDLAGHRLRRLTERGFTPLSVLAEGETYVIDHMGSVGSGAHPAHCIEEIDSSYLRSAERAAKAFHDLDVAGVDVLCADTSQPATSDNHIIIEVNSKPEIATHAAAPSPRAPRSFPTRIVDSVLSEPKTGPFRPRVTKPTPPDTPTSAQLLAAELAARDMDVVWLTSRYFRASADDTTVSVWGSATDRTGGSARTATKREDLARALLRRAHLPQPKEGNPRAVSGTRLRFLVAHGRVLAAIDTAEPCRKNVLKGVHPSFRSVAAAAVAAFPGLDLADVTLVMEDPRKPAVKREVVVESVRAEPDLVEFSSLAGQRRDIIRTIVDLHLGADSHAREPDVTWAAPTDSPSSADSSDAAGIGRRARRIAGAIKRRLE